MRSSVYLVVLAVAGLVPSLLAAQGFSTAGAIVREQPISLFDGQTLNGWAKRNGKTHPGWVVDDGALMRKSGGGDLYYEHSLRDFELHFQWKVSAGGNSGVKYRVRQYGKQWLGCEYQILDDAGHKDANKSAGLYDVFDAPSFSPAAIPEVWHRSTIVVCGNRIEHWLNGVQTVNTVVGSPHWCSAVANSKFSDMPGFGENREGRLFLQDHGNTVWYREIILVPLCCDRPTDCAGLCDCRSVCTRPIFRTRGWFKRRRCR